MAVRSTSAQAIRARGRKGRVRLDQAVDAMAEHHLYKPLEEWTLEELARGKPRNPDGTWRTGNLKWITPAITREAKRRLLTEGFAELASHMGHAIKVLTDLMMCEELDDNGKPIVDNRTRMDAAKFIIEHVLGKPRQAIELDTQEGYKEFLASALVLTDGTAAHPVINGTVVEPEDEQS